jgi:hypothetical protein
VEAAVISCPSNRDKITNALSLVDSSCWVSGLLMACCAYHVHIQVRCMSCNADAASTGRSRAACCVHWAGAERPGCPSLSSTRSSDSSRTPVHSLGCTESALRPTSHQAGHRLLAWPQFQLPCMALVCWLRLCYQCGQCLSCILASAPAAPSGHRAHPQHHLLLQACKHRCHKRTGTWLGLLPAGP